MPDEPIDPKQANIAMGLAVTRWRKLPDDPIGHKLDNPQEWLQEAALMNHFMPSHLTPLGYSFVAVAPTDFAVGITTVRLYAGLIYKHMTPISPPMDIHAMTSDAAFNQAAMTHAGRSASELSSLSGDFVSQRPALGLFGGE
jgi:hypothetical protein